MLGTITGRAGDVARGVWVAEAARGLICGRLSLLLDGRVDGLYPGGCPGGGAYWGCA